MAFDIDLSGKHATLVPIDEDHACLTGVVHDYPKESKAYLNHKKRVISILSSIEGRDRIKALTIGAAGVRSLFFIKLFKNLESLYVDSPFVVDFEDALDTHIKHFVLRRKSIGVRDIRPILSLPLETLEFNPEGHECNFLKNLNSLRYAKIINCCMIDYSFLNGKSLTSLEISGGRSSRIIGLSERISHVQIAFCSKLISMEAKFVRSLVIRVCRNFDYSCIGKMVDLEFLVVEDSRIIDNFEFLMPCKKLKRLDIISRSVLDGLDKLIIMKNLKAIKIMQNNIKIDSLRNVSLAKKCLISNGHIAFNNGHEISSSSFDQVCKQNGLPDVRVYDCPL